VYENEISWAHYNTGNLHPFHFSQKQISRGESEEVKKEKNNEKLEDAKNFFVESDRVDQL